MWKENFKSKAVLQSLHRGHWRYSFQETVWCKFNKQSTALYSQNCLTYKNVRYTVVYIQICTEGFMNHLLQQNCKQDASIQYGIVPEIICLRQYTVARYAAALHKM
jgi:hypothetical protein